MDTVNYSNLRKRKFPLKYSTHSVKVTHLPLRRRQIIMVIVGHLGLLVFHFSSAKQKSKEPMVIKIHWFQTKLDKFYDLAPVSVPPLPCTWLFSVFIRREGKNQQIETFCSLEFGGGYRSEKKFNRRVKQRQQDDQFLEQSKNPLNFSVRRSFGSWTSSKIIRTNNNENYTFMRWTYRLKFMNCTEKKFH